MFGWVTAPLRRWGVDEALAVPVGVAAAAVAAVVLWRVLLRCVCGFGRRLPAPPRVRPSDKQSFAVPNSARPGESAVYRGVELRDGAPLMRTGANKVETLYENFMYSVKKTPDSYCCGTIRADGSGIDYVTYREMHERALRFASGLLARGVPAGSNVALYSSNRLEWAVAEQACNMFAMPTIAIYDTLGEDVVEFIAEQAEVRAIVCSADRLPKALKCMDSVKCVQLVVSMDELDGGRAASARVCSMRTLEAEGAQRPAKPAPPSSSGLATIMYTSGTTGMPKGAMLTHLNLMADAAAAAACGADAVPGDVYLSYLPLAHIFERLMHIFMMGAGGCVVFYRGKVETLFPDIQICRPTIFASVPRLYNRVYDKVTSQLNKSPIKRLLFKLAMNAKRADLRRGIRRYTIWDALVFKKIQKALGGRVRFMVTGSAPMTGEVMEFLRICFDVYVFEGYGQTEAAAAVTMTRHGDQQLGHVGAPVACCEIKLLDVPEMNYSASGENPIGELCVRGNNVFAGYYKNPEQTREALDQDGWLHSGDIARLNPNGTFSIIDRRKNIFKLSQGEYIAPEKIEGVYLRAAFVQQIWVYGDSLQSVLVAVVVPDPEALQGWAKEQRRPDAGDLGALCADKAVRQMVLDDMNAVAKEKKLRGFEMVRAIHLTPAPFDEPRGLVTPSMKLKRPQLKAFFAKEIQEMYRNVTAVPYR